MAPFSESPTSTPESSSAAQMGVVTAPTIPRQHKLTYIIPTLGSGAIAGFALFFAVNNNVPNWSWINRMGWTLILCIHLAGLIVLAAIYTVPELAPKLPRALDISNESKMVIIGVAYICVMGHLFGMGIFQPNKKRILSTRAAVAILRFSALFGSIATTYVCGMYLNVWSLLNRGFRLF